MRVLLYIATLLTGYALGTASGAIAMHINKPWVAAVGGVAALVAVIICLRCIDRLEEML